MNELSHNLDAILKEKQEKIIPGNIKYGVTIFDIEGSYGGGAQLPYTELEYIEATGTQYIDTGYTPNHDTTVELSVSNITYMDSPMISASKVWTPNRFILLADHNYRWYYNGEIIVGNVVENSEEIDNIFIYRKYFKLNGEVLSSIQATNSSFVADTTLRIFGGVAGGSAGNFTKYRLHSFKLSESGLSDNPTYIFDMIPVIENSSGKLGLYDKVNDKFYSNLGEGEFVAGPMKESILTITPSDEQQEFVGDYDKIVVEPISNKNIAVIDGTYVNSSYTATPLPFKLDGKAITQVIDLDMSAQTSLGESFSYCTNLKEVSLINTSNITSVSRSFLGCTNLQKIHLFDTSNVTNMEYFLQSCTSLTELPQFDTSKVYHISNAFRQCTNLTTVPVLNLAGTGNTTLSNMFLNCFNLSNQSLDNILYTMYEWIKPRNNLAETWKKLSTIGLSAEQIEICKTLPNYTLFTSEGGLGS